MMLALGTFSANFKVGRAGHRFTCQRLPERIVDHATSCRPDNIDPGIRSHVRTAKLLKHIDVLSGLRYWLAGAEVAWVGGSESTLWRFGFQGGSDMWIVKIAIERPVTFIVFASSAPNLQPAPSGAGLSESDLNDLPLNDGNAGDSSRLCVVQRIRNRLPRGEQTLPPQLRIQLLSNPSIFVRAAVSGAVREAGMAAIFTTILILVFLGSWRSTVNSGVSIPLAILSWVIVHSPRSRARRPRGVAKRLISITDLRLQLMPL